MRLITIAGSCDQLDDLFAQLRQDFEQPDRIPSIEAYDEVGTWHSGKLVRNHLTIQFVESPEGEALGYQERKEA